MAVTYRRNVPKTAGIRLATDTGDEEIGGLHYALGAVMRPHGMVHIPGASKRLYGMDRFDAYEAQLGLSSTDGAVLVLLTCGGRCWVIAWDCLNLLTLGFFYAGLDPEWSGLPSQDFDRTDIDLQVLRRNLTTGLTWRGERLYDSLILRNGYDLNFVLETSPDLLFRPMGYQLRPLKPTVSASPMATTPNVQASLSIWTLTLSASKNLPGHRGNTVAVSVTYDTAVSQIRSELSGRGSVSDPFIYALRVPTNPVPSVDYMIDWINRDGTASGIVEASGGGSGGVQEDAGTLLFGGTDEIVGGFNPLVADSAQPTMDLVSGTTSSAQVGYSAKDRVTVMLTYVMRRGRTERLETAPSIPSEVAIVRNSVLSVSIEDDPDAGDFEAVRIYVSEEAEDDIGAYRGPYWLCAEVPAGQQVVNITPQMKTGVRMPMETMTPPSASLMRFFNAPGGGTLILSGNRAHPTRVWAMRTATDRIPLPESCHLTNYVELFDVSGSEAKARVRALVVVRGHLIALFGRSGAIIGMSSGGASSAAPEAAGGFSASPGVRLGGTWTPVTIRIGGPEGEDQTKEFLTR
jgi:hypothetical protein